MDLSGPIFGNAILILACRRDLGSDYPVYLSYSAGKTRLFEMNFLASFYEQDGGREAIRVGSESISYARFRNDIDIVALWLRQQGLRPNARIAIHFRGGQCYWNWVAHIAAMRLGLAHATFEYPAKLQGMMAVAPFHAVLGDLAQVPETPPEVKRLAFNPASLAPLTEQLGRAHVPLINPAEEQAVRLAFTSGTTGRPKLLRWDAQMIEARIGQVAQIAGIGAETQLYPLLGPSTTGGFRYPLATWLAGGCVLMTGNPDQPRADRVFMDEDSTLLVCSPAQMIAALQRKPGLWQGKESRRVIMLGARVPLRLRDEALKRACGALTISYGSTETGNVASADAAILDQHPDAVGQVQSNVSVEIVDRQGAVRPAGEPGIVRLRTPYMCSGYVGSNGARASARSFRDGWFYPGDVGILFEDGTLAITGRVAETINIGGVKMLPAILETRFGDVAGVTDLCVFGLRQQDRDVLGVAVVCDDQVALPQLRKELMSRLPKRGPIALFRMKQIPRNAAGKVNRREIAQRLTALKARQRKA